MLVVASRRLLTSSSSAILFFGFCCFTVENVTYSHTFMYYGLAQGLQTFLSESHINYYTTVRGTDIIRNK